MEVMHSLLTPLPPQYTELFRVIAEACGVYRGSCNVIYIPLLPSVLYYTILYYAMLYYTRNGDSLLFLASPIHVAQVVREPQSPEARPVARCLVSRGSNVVLIWVVYYTPSEETGHDQKRTALEPLDIHLIHCPAFTYIMSTWPKPYQQQFPK